MLLVKMLLLDKLLDRLLLQRLNKKQKGRRGDYRSPLIAFFMIGQWALSSIETALLMVDAPSLYFSFSGTETPGAIYRFRDGLKYGWPCLIILDGRRGDMEWRFY